MGGLGRTRRRPVRAAVALLLCLAAAYSAVACRDGRTPAAEEEIGAMKTEDFKETTEPSDYVRVTVRGLGDIVIRLREDAAPETVRNFRKLVGERFYDGLTFHRVIRGFMIQGGDPRGDGTGGSKGQIKGEFRENGVANNLKHLRGVVSMARTADPNSASSQFFICHADAPHLDGHYAAFGYVVAGLDVVDAIARVRTLAQDRPAEPVVMERACFVTKR